MALKPILFNTDMVRAILAGRKTQTRRIIKLTEGFTGRPVGESGNPNNPLGFMYPCGIKRPPCNKGDILWMRETWCRPYVPDKYAYRADYGDHDVIPNPVGNVELSANMFRWHPSIHMPKEAARIFLKVKDVRVEPLQNIGHFDALNEGITHLYDNLSDAEYESWAARTGCHGMKKSDWPYTNYLWHGHFGSCGTGNRLSDAWPYQYSGYENPRESFSSLWNSTVPLKDLDIYGWDANPWVWVIEFERCEKPEGWCL